MKTILPERIKQGDTVGLCVPCQIATKEEYEPIIKSIEALGFKVKIGKNFYARGWGYAATPEERAEDIMEKVLDDEVKMIYFGGGDGADEVIPLLDYDAIAAHPKIWHGFSDGTSILNTITAKTGLVTWYGLAPNVTTHLSSYNRTNFERHIIKRDTDEHIKLTDFVEITPGKAEGKLIGGYIGNIAYVTSCGWVPAEPGEDYIMFIEQHRMFTSMKGYSVDLARLEYSPFFSWVKGLVVGSYNDEGEPCDELRMRLELLGKRHGIPVAYTDDFGHGSNHAILPIGVHATLDTAAKTLKYHGLV